MSSSPRDLLPAYSRRLVGVAGVVTSAALLATGCSSVFQASSQTPAVNSAAESEELARGKTITIAASGDVLPHPPVTNNAAALALESGRDVTFDYYTQLKAIEPWLESADLAICQLETPIAADNASITPPYTLVFNSPPDLPGELAKVGYDACSFASNHSYDQGLEGITRSEEAVRGAGLGFAGPTMNEERSGKAELLRVGNGTDQSTVGFLTYTYTLPNAAEPNTVVPDGAPWLADSLWPIQDSAGILEDAQEARDNGAEFVVVYMHWGTEYTQEPTEEQRRIARDLLSSDAVDLVIGSHAHVVQPCEIINGKHVMYGMGNSLSNQAPFTASSLPPESQEGILTHFTLTKDGNGKVTTSMKYQPTWVDIVNRHQVRLTGPEVQPESWNRVVDTVDSLGGCQATPAAGGAPHSASATTVSIPTAEPGVTAPVTGSADSPAAESFPGYYTTLAPIEDYYSDPAAAEPTSAP